MVASLQEIRKKLQEQTDRQNKSRAGGYTGDNPSYPFWNIPEGSTAVIRFLPDGDESNEFFWREKRIIKIPFRGIKGQPDKKNFTVNVPSPTMFGKSCPIEAEMKEWWKDEELKPTALKYYRKASFIYQGFVVSSDLVEEKAPENPIRRFNFTKGLHEKIKAALMDPDFESLPIDAENGFDFKIVRGKKGQWSDYDASSYARKSRPLSDEELAMVEQHKLAKLSDSMPKEISDDDINMIFEMFQSSLADELFDPERFSRFYRSGPETNAATTTDEDDVDTKTDVTKNNMAEKLATKAKVEEAEAQPEPAKVAEAPKAAAAPAGKNVASILEQLKKNQKKG